MKDLSRDYSSECRILGQALTSLAVMSTLPGINHLLEFLNQLINSFPGVAGSTICHRYLKHEIGFTDDLISALQSSLHNSPAGKAHPDIEIPDKPDRPVFTFKTTDQTFGFLVILIDNRKEYNKFSAIINNLVSIISIELDSREKKQEQEKNQDKLESIVQERTALLRTEIEVSKSLEKELRAQTEDLEAAQQIAKLGSYKIDLKSGKWQASEEAKQILGIDDETSFKPLEWFNLIHPDSRKKLEEGFGGLFNYPDKSFFVEFKMTRPSNKESIWISGSGKLRTDKNKEPLELIGTIQNITERKNAEQEIEKAQYYLTKAQELGKIGTWEIDIVNDTLTWTDQNYENFGVEKGTPLSMEVFISCVHPDDKDYVIKKWTKAQEGKPYDIEHRVIANGQTRWVREKAFMSFDDEGKAVSAIGFTQEITDVVEARNRLKVSEEKFASAFHNHPSAMQFLDAETGKRIMVNKSLVELTGYTEEELLNKNAFKGGIAIDQKDIDSFVRNIREKGLVRGLPVKINTKNQGDKYIIVSGTEINIEGRKTVLTSYDDITKLKEAEEELKNKQLLIQEERDTAESYLDIAAEIILKLDKKGDITLMNESGHQLLGYNNDELVGKSWFETCLPEEIRKEVKIMFTRIIKGEIENVRNFQNQVLCRSGDKKDIYWHNTLLYDHQGNINGVLCSGEDITAIKKAEEELKKAFEEMQKMKEMVEQENVYLKHEVFQQLHFSEIIGEAKTMHKMLRQIELVAGTDSVVLITGETGTGKELIARAIHKNSKRKDKALIRVNCPAIPNELIESEFFGHEKGAFTGAYEKKAGRFEMAHKGTIFLDEIGDLPLNLQVKLLRVLQEGEFERLGSGKSIKVDVRIVAATNRDLEQLVIDGKFRQDLYFRLKVFPIYSPSLKERKEDIPLLVSHFVENLNTKMGKNVSIVPQKTMDKLLSYDWPGNVRELENIVERAMVVSQAKTLAIGNWLGNSLAQKEMQNLISLEELERNYITDILNKTMWRIRGPKGAANILGLKPTTLESRMKKLGITR